MAKHKRNRKFAVTRRRAVVRAEKEQPMKKCLYCGGANDYHRAGCRDAPKPPERVAFITVDDDPARLLTPAEWQWLVDRLPPAAEQGGGQ